MSADLSPSLRRAKPLLFRADVDSVDPGSSPLDDLWATVAVGRAFFVLVFSPSGFRSPVLHFITPCCGALTTRRPKSLLCSECQNEFALGTQRPSGSQPMGPGRNVHALRRRLEEWLNATNANPLEALLWADEFVAMPVPTAEQLDTTAVPTLPPHQVPAAVRAAWRAHREPALACPAAKPPSPGPAVAPAHGRPVLL